jgi:hypothetical protein
MATAAPVTPAEAKLSRPLVIGLGAGSGVALLTVILQVTRPEAKPVIEAVLRWGPLFVIVLLGMELLHSTINTWGKQFVTAATANAVALQSMADAMQRISQKEDERDRERELMLDHLAFTTQQTLSKVELLLERGQAEKAKSQSVGGSSNG